MQQPPVTRVILVPDYQIDRQALGSPISVGLHELADQFQVVLVSDLQQHDRQVAGNGVAPEPRLPALVPGEDTRISAEGGVGIDIERIEGGFAAITYNTESKTRRVRISLDYGKTWNAIDAGLKPSDAISSIRQCGKHLVCGHPDGIFRSSDMGKTWKMVQPGVHNKVFNLYTSGNILFAVTRNSGC